MGGFQQLCSRRVHDTRKYSLQYIDNRSEVYGAGRKKILNLYISLHARVHSLGTSSNMQSPTQLFRLD
jgi:hypothetical protein